MKRPEAGSYGLRPMWTRPARESARLIQPLPISSVFDSLQLSTRFAPASLVAIGPARRVASSKIR